MIEVSTGNYRKGVVHGVHGSSSPNVERISV
jgi:hypothetical protein